MLDDLNARRVSNYGGQAHRYGSYHDDPAGDFIEPTFLSYSDYSGGSAEQSNVRVFKEQFKELEDEEWWELSGGHGTVAIAIKIDADERHSEIREFLEGLDDYPIADEEDFSQREMELEEEAWTSYGEDDWKSEVTKWMPEEVVDRAETLFDGHWWELHRIVSELTNSYPHHEEGGGVYWNHRSMAWDTFAKLQTVKAWDKFLRQVAFESTSGPYAWTDQGKLAAEIRKLRDKKLSWPAQVALGWEHGGARSFRHNLVEAMRTEFGRYPPRADLTDEQKDALQFLNDRLFNMDSDSLWRLFQVLAPAWDSLHTHAYQKSISPRDGPPDFNTTWMSTRFVEHALDPAFGVILDAVVEGDPSASSNFTFLVKQWFAAHPG